MPWIDSIPLILSIIALIGAFVAQPLLASKIRRLRVEIERNGAGEPAKGMLKDEIRKLTRRVEENEVSWDQIYGKMSRALRAAEKREQRDDKAAAENEPEAPGDRRSELWRRARRQAAVSPPPGK